MPKGTGRPANRAHRMIMKGMKMARRSGIPRETGTVPGAEGTPRSRGNYEVRPTAKQEARSESSYQSWKRTKGSSSPNNKHGNHPSKKSKTYVKAGASNPGTQKRTPTRAKAKTKAKSKK